MANSILLYISSFQMCIYLLSCYFVITGYFYLTLAGVQANTVGRIWNPVVQGGLMSLKHQVTKHLNELYFPWLNSGKCVLFQYS